MNTRTATDPYGHTAVSGWDPYSELVPCVYSLASVRHATQPYGASSDVRPRSVDSITDTPVGVGQNIFVPRLTIDQKRHSFPVDTLTCSVILLSTVNG